MTLQTIRSVRFNENAIKYALSEQIEDLDDLIEAPERGSEFFGKTHVTSGMADLMRLGINRLVGTSKQGVFELCQSMGGGKTHSMLSLGYLALDPSLAAEAGIELSADVRPSKVVVINGRHIPHDRYLWGEIARQLGKEEEFAGFWSHGPRAPNEKDWTALIGDEAVLILMDELPFYLKSAVAEPVAGGNLGDVTSAAVSNLFSASLKLPRLCIVIATLRGAYGQHNTKLNRLISEISNEAGRQAKPITPVELGSDEIYKILRKRLVTQMPPPIVIEAVSDAYSQAISDATKAKTIDRSVAGYEAEIAATYPFHPSFKTVLATFKENEGFRQTRGLMTVAALMVRSALNRRFDDVYLVGPQHLDFEDQEVRDQINSIFNLDAAITQDVASIGSSPAHAQIIDDSSGNDAASQAGRMLVMASLAQAEDAVKGLTEADLIGYLVAPHRPAAEFRTAVEEFTKRSWYLHRRENGAVYFSRNENLTKKIEQLAANAPDNKIDDDLTKRIHEIFKPRRKVAYSDVLPLPTYEKLAESTGGDRVLIVLRPDNRLPPEDAQKLFSGVQEKNNFALIACNDAAFNSVIEHVRRAYAISSVLQRESEHSPNRVELQDKFDAAQKDAYQALASAFDRVYFPTYSRTLQEHLAHVPLRLDAHRHEGKSNGFDGEAAVEVALKTAGSSKLRDDVEAEFDVLRRRAEELLWPEGGERRARRQDIGRRAVTVPRWPWLPKDGLDRLVKIAHAQDAWIDHGDGWIEKGPFPLKKTGVKIGVRAVDNDTGKTTLAISPSVGGSQVRIYWSTKPTVSDADPIVEGNSLETEHVRLFFLAVDPMGKHETGPAQEWRGTILLRTERSPRMDGTGTDVTVETRPAARLLWNIDSRTARDGQPYEGPILCPADRDTVITLYAEANGVEAVERITVAKLVNGEAPVDMDLPARVLKQFRLSETARIFEVLRHAKAVDASFKGVQIAAGTGKANVLNVFGPDVSLGAQQIESFITVARQVLPEENASLELDWRTLSVSAARDIEAIVSATGEDVRRSDIRQD